MSKPTSNSRGKTSNPKLEGQRVFGAGMTLAVAVGLFAYGGLWLDRQLGTRPWMLLLLVFCGIIGGMLHLVRVVAPEMLPFWKPAKKDGDRQQNDQPPPG